MAPFNVAAVAPIEDAAEVVVVERVIFKNWAKFS